MGNTYRDGKLHVMARMCETCIFRPGNLMDLKPGRVDEMVQASLKSDTAIVCHKTIHTKPQRNAVCRGFFNRHDTLPLRLGKLLNVIEYVKK